MILNVESTFKMITLYFPSVINRDGKKLHLFGHLLRNKIAEIIAKIARKIEKNLMGFWIIKIFIAISCFLNSLFSWKNVRKIMFLNKIAFNCNLYTKLH